MSIPRAADAEIEIRDVWQNDFETQLKLIEDNLDAFPYIAMDTEFPGAIQHSAADDTPDETYSVLKINVDDTKLIQLGLALFDENGNHPIIGGKIVVWQFNFREFDPDVDTQAIESIALLRRSGINFSRNKVMGIDILEFGEQLMSSGIVMNDDNHWVTFHGRSDIGYLIKLLTGRVLPLTLDKFKELTALFFPNLYDVKHLVRFCVPRLDGGLKRIAQVLGVERIGTAHQAGSDSLLTFRAFIKLKKDTIHYLSFQDHVNVLFGLE